jgi:polygalacturonase
MSAFTRRDFLISASLGAIRLACGRLVRPAGVRGFMLSSAGAPSEEGVEEILRHIHAPTFPDRTLRLTELGARGDGSTDALPALLRAIDQLNVAGGGRVVLSDGTWWMNGPIHLKSNIHVHLEDGATVRFNPDPDLYLPMVLTRWEGTEIYNYSPLIYAYQAVNVAITGKGMIDGNAKNTFGTWLDCQSDAQLRLRQMGANGVPVHERLFGKGHWLRPSMIQFFGCANVLVDGPTIIDSPFWIVHPIYSHNVTVRNLRVDSSRLNNDGVDPDSSTDVLIERCVFNTGDDAVAIKSGRDQDGWRVGRPTENVIVRDCEMPSVLNGVAIGSEMSAGVRNVYVENCRIGKARSALLFKANLDRGGAVEHVRVRDVTVDSASTFVHFTTAYPGYRGGNVPPNFSDFVLARVSCGQAEKGVSAVGVSSAPLRGVVLRDVTVRQTKKPYEMKLSRICSQTTHSKRVVIV